MSQSVLFIFAFTIIFGNDLRQLTFGLRLIQEKPCTSSSSSSSGCPSQSSSERLADPVATAVQGRYEGPSVVHQLPPPSSFYAFEWKHEEFAQCSVTCGEGVEISEVTCREYKTGTRVRDGLCEQTTKKPQPVIRPCWHAKCQAVWVAGDWSDCSVICGGGTSKRIVYCAEEVDAGKFQRTLDRLCRAGKPDSEKTCNVNACPQWHAGQWSKCSTSCGTGLQQRAIVCRRTPSLDCIDDMKPVSERLCHQKPCSSSSSPSSSSSIPSDSNRGQSSSSLKGHDPSDLGDPIETYNYRHQNRGGETAAADGYRGGGGGGGREGGLVIIDDPHPLSLSPPTDEENEGSGEVERFPQSVTMVATHVGMTTLTSEAVYSSGDDDETTDEVKEGRLEGPEVIQAATDHLCPPVHKEELDEYSIYQLEPRSELTLTAARRSLVVGLIPGTNLRICCPSISSISSSTANTSSVWIRNGDAISKTTLFIRNVRQEQAGIYFCIRGNSVSSKVTIQLRFPDDVRSDKSYRTNITLDRLKLEKKLKDASRSESGKSGVALLLRNVIAPDSAMLDIVPLTYVVSSEWSQCQCTAPEAIQTRSVGCEFLMQSYYIAVDGSYCARRKVKAPLARKDCSKTCYSWITGDWKQCAGKPCVSEGVGTRSRLVECFGINGTRVAESRCHAIADRPTNSEQCSHKLCHATWMPMPWSECSVSCGHKGLKTREVPCVWAAYPSNPTSDDSFCSHEVQPTTQKLCFNPPCSSRYCRDESLFCSNIPLFRLCHVQKYASKCCYSCRRKRYRTTATNGWPRS